MATLKPHQEKGQCLLMNTLPESQHPLVYTVPMASHLAVCNLLHSAKENCTAKRANNNSSSFFQNGNNWFYPMQLY